ncbi:hypothetical protein ABOZ73_15955 [Caulobacter sp. 73W]|uniref:Uncharacterized protein n=1 Tax=Caulobacter sp. 73W TaxID=3161137 RepID=A0AB39KRG3_9CAUL
MRAIVTSLMVAGLVSATFGSPALAAGPHFESEYQTNLPPKPRFDLPVKHKKKASPAALAARAKATSQAAASAAKPRHRTAAAAS